MMFPVGMCSAPASGDFPAPVAPAELDRDTLARCRDGDPAAFRSFVVRYQRPVFACLSRMLGAGPLVEDLAQEVFLRAFRAFPSFDVDAASKPVTWLLTIATRVALNARKRRAIPLRPLAEAQHVPDAVTPETERARSELGARIERAAAELTDEQRVTLVLADYHGFSMLEIADATRVAEATVKTRLFRARERMRALLGDLGTERSGRR